VEKCVIAPINKGDPRGPLNWKSQVRKLFASG
jgi:hypothetical protein